MDLAKSQSGGVTLGNSIEIDSRSEIVATIWIARVGSHFGGYQAAEATEI